MLQRTPARRPSRPRDAAPSTAPAAAPSLRSCAVPQLPQAHEGDVQLAQRLQRAGLQPTRQRLAIARVLLRQPTHMHADQVLQAARTHYPALSRATVYSTLPLLVQHGLLRALPLGLEHQVYDSRTDAHPHLLVEETGEVMDLPPDCIRWDALPAMASGLEIAGIDLVVRVRRTTSATPAPAATSAPAPRRAG
ncbi:Fur family transcriptional regulator [Comamonas sp. GB3 AK4-5]|uniref:Fur family transcriptional regulator n=1 Tax=Comamonas sp. GB3 AK4-5 TaxID=3231487 RepID=UPI00351DDE7F